MATDLTALTRRIRSHLITMTTAAGSGHLTSSLSAVELMTGLMFSGIFRADLKRPDYPNNDRLIFSKGHAAPLLYTLYAVAGVVPHKELSRLRKLGSRLEGHPMPTWRYTEAPTGSLGQGLSIALGEAMAAKISRLTYRVFCLLGDSEMAEGSVWEAIQLAGHVKINNLVAVLDLNRLGQAGPTMLQHDARGMARRVAGFGWETIVIDGHDLTQVVSSYRRAARVKNRPVMIIAKTIKGRGVALVENQNGWHGRALTADQAAVALKAFGPVDQKVRGLVTRPEKSQPRLGSKRTLKVGTYKLGELVAPREALGRGLVRLGTALPSVVVLDGDVKNSTYTELFEKKLPRRFIQGYIAEQNLVGLAGGLAARGLRPVTATFGAFFTRAFDQLRMQSYATTPAVYIGTHVGVHIGQDGASQMGLQDIAMFRTLERSIVLYPGDAVSAEQLLSRSMKETGLVYIRATRNPLPVLYKPTQRFPIGGSFVWRKSKKDRGTIVAAGVTLHEALKAADQLARRRIHVRVVDLYSIKPIDAVTLRRAAKETRHLVVVEDHYPEGGMAEAIRTALGSSAGTVTSLAIRKTPHSGRPEELLAMESIDARAIVAAIMKLR